MTFDKTRLLAPTAPLYEIALQHTELVADWHCHPQPLHQIYLSVSLLCNLASALNERLLRELVATADFHNGQTYPSHGQRRVPSSRSLYPDRH